MRNISQSPSHHVNKPLLFRWAAPAVDVCSSRPCQNGGRCTSLMMSNSYLCNCMSGYVGRNCEIRGEYTDTYYTLRPLFLFPPQSINSALNLKSGKPYDKISTVVQWQRAYISWFYFWIAKSSFSFSQLDANCKFGVLLYLYFYHIMEFPFISFKL